MMFMQSLKEELVKDAGFGKSLKNNNWAVIEAIQGSHPFNCSMIKN